MVARRWLRRGFPRRGLPASTTAAAGAVVGAVHPRDAQTPPARRKQVVETVLPYPSVMRVKVAAVAAKSTSTAVGPHPGVHLSLLGRNAMMFTETMMTLAMWSSVEARDTVRLPSSTLVDHSPTAPAEEAGWAFRATDRGMRRKTGCSDSSSPIGGSR